MMYTFNVSTYIILFIITMTLSKSCYFSVASSESVGTQFDAARKMTKNAPNNI